MAVRVETVPDQMTANWRIAMFCLSNMFLSIDRAFSRSNHQLNPTELLIYLTICVGNVQKLMRERSIPEGFSATATLPREWVVPISRNAIASSTGLPRETVRRQVQKLIERNLLIEDERGGVTPPPGVIGMLGLEPILEPLLTEFCRTAEQLYRIGVIAHSDD